MEHLEKGAKNTKTVPWQIQNDKIEFLSQFVRLKIEPGIPDYYVIIIDQFTGRFSNKDSLLLCLRCVRFWANKKTSVKHFASILLLLQRNGIGPSKCPAQAYDGGSAMSSEESGAVLLKKKE